MAVLNPESNPILVLDFGAQYSKLIARRVPEAKTFISFFSILVFLIVSSVSCTKYFYLRFSQINVGPAAAEAEIQSSGHGLTIQFADTVVTLSMPIYIYHPPKERGGGVGFVFTAASGSGAIPRLRSLVVTPIKFKARTPGQTASPIHATITDVETLDAQELDRVDSRILKRLPHNKTIYRFGGGLRFPYYVSKARVELILDDGNGSDIPISFTVTRR